MALNEKNLLRDNPDLYVKLNDNLAYSKLKLGDFRDLPGLFIKSLKISDSLKLSSGSINKVHISEYYQTVKDTAKSIYYAEKALNQSKSQKSYGEILSSLKQLSVVDKKILQNITLSTLSLMIVYKSRKENRRKNLPELLLKQMKL